MSYKAVKDFADVRDNYHVYKAGDEFPRSGIAVTQGRIAELAGASNRLGVPLIVEVSEVSPAPDVDLEPVAEQKPQRKPRKVK